MRRTDSLSLAWVLTLGVGLVAALGVGAYAGFQVVRDLVAKVQRATSEPPATVLAQKPALPTKTTPQRPATPVPTPFPQPVMPTAAPAARQTPQPSATPVASRSPMRVGPSAAPLARPNPLPAIRPVETTLAAPPPRPTPQPTPQLTVRPAEPTVTPPQFTAADARRSADDAYKDLWAALLGGVGTTATKYVPTAKLQTMRNERAVVADFMGLPVSRVQVSKTTTNGDKAVLFAKATAAGITDEKGRPATVEVVVRMYRENGYWKVLSQMWLVSTPPERERQEALGWLKAAPTGQRDEHAAAIARLEALGVKLDADGFQSAVARGDIEQARLFLQAGMSARTRLRDGGSPFNLALLGLQGGDASKQDMAIALIRAGADIEERTPTGLTPLMRALVACKPRLIDALVQAHARLDAKDNDGKTAVDWARMSCPSLEGPLRAAGAR